MTIRVEFDLETATVWHETPSSLSAIQLSKQDAAEVIRDLASFLCARAEIVGSTVVEPEIITTEKLIEVSVPRAMWLQQELGVWAEHRGLSAEERTSGRGAAYFLLVTRADAAALCSRLRNAPSGDRTALTRIADAISQKLQ